jgi:hypothetical protein
MERTPLDGSFLEAIRNPRHPTNHDAPMSAKRLPESGPHDDTRCPSSDFDSGS